MPDRVIRGRDGRDGRDGRQGDPGPQGEPGRDVDPQFVLRAINDAVKAAMRGDSGADGRSPELDFDEDRGIVWRYAGDDKWRDLVAAAVVKGRDGRDGVDGRNGIHGKAGERGPRGPKGEAVLSGARTPTADDGQAGDFWIDYSEWVIYGPKVGDEWGAPTSLIGPKGPKGDKGERGAIVGGFGGSSGEGGTGTDGREVELQNSGTHIQWRYVGDASWTNLVALADLTGADGQGVPTGGSTGQFLRKKSGTNYDTEWAAASGGGTYDSAFLLQWFGDGSDGDVTISSGTTTLTRDMYYNNLTINGTGILNPNGFRVFVSGTLDLTGAAAGAIQRNGTAGANASGSTGGSATGLGINGFGTIGGYHGVSLSGPNSTATNGANGSQSGVSLVLLGGLGGAGGNGGLGSSGTAGTGGVAPTALTVTSFRRITADFKRVQSSNSSASSLFFGGSAGSGGGAGSGNGTQAGGGGGVSGRGAGCIAIYANTISITGAATGAIQAMGAAGGNGAAGPNTNTGGGAGAGGTGGGHVYIVVGTIVGSASNIIEVSGGAGGNGGNGNGTGAGGAGGSGASGGRVTVIKLSDGSVTETVGSTGTAGGSASGSTAGTGGAGNTCQVSLP